MVCIHVSTMFFLRFLIFLTTTSILNFPSSQQQQQNSVISSFNFSNSPWLPTQRRIILSPNSTFAAGFLSLPTSPSLFTFSIWYYNVTSHSVVWSANRRSPVSSAGSLLISLSGELRLVNSSTNGRNLWPSRAVSSGNRTGLWLNSNGNLVFGAFQSFDFPTDTILPDQEVNGTILVSENGKYEFNSRNLTFLGTNSSYWSSSANFIGLNDLGVISIGEGNPYWASDHEVKRLRRLSLDNDGNLRQYSYDEELGQWVIRWNALRMLCRIRGTCGENSICLYDTSNLSTYCVCPPGYVRSVDNNSCKLRIPIRKSKFLALDFVRYRGLDESDMNEVAIFSNCRAKCLANSKCLGFMFKYDGTNYCRLQLNIMHDGYWSPGTRTVMYLKVDESETSVTNFTGMMSSIETMCPARIHLPQPHESKTNTRNIVIVCAMFAVELLTGAFFFWIFFKKYLKFRDMARTFALEALPGGGPKRFSYGELKAATNNFTDKIGQGGFGVVYGGKLSDGRMVAVKCLKNIVGSDADFWSEVSIIARMHHLNLVRLWGFCAEKGRRILVYEYVPNGSLHEFLFQDVDIESSEVDPKTISLPGSSETVMVLDSSEIVPILGSKNKPILDWDIRYRIALGVARAIAYMHEECLEWVLHCDIKPGNILLGDDFCPKVSDFGLAKLKKKEDMMSVSRMRGTPGYVAPEWIHKDQITSKADVYSYGVVLLEIISGTKGSTKVDPTADSCEWFFPKWAFEKVFKEMNLEEILDHRIKHTYDSREHFETIDRMVKTAMWCLQDRPDMRPSMGKVAKMLEGTIEISEPKMPTAYYLSKD